MHLRERIKNGILMFFATIIALAIGLGIGRWLLLDVGLRGFLTALAWLTVIFLLLDIRNHLHGILKMTAEINGTTVEGLSTIIAKLTFARKDKDDG